MKTCVKCGQIRPPSGVCKNCRKQYGRKYYRRNRAKWTRARSTLLGALRDCLINAGRSDRRARPLAFDLVRQDLIDLWQKQRGECALTGLAMELAPGSLRRVSLDRIDSSAGYVPDNVQLVCKFANLGKNNASCAEFRAVLWEAVHGSDLQDVR